MLRKFRAILDDGGSVLLDVYSLTAFEQREEEATVFETNLLNGFWSPNRYYGFLNTYKYESEKVILDKYTLIESTRTRTVYNWLQYFSPEDLASGSLRSAALPSKKLYSDVAGNPYEPQANEFAVVAGKP